jgi:hypothetical protein
MAKIILIILLWNDKDKAGIITKRQRKVLQRRNGKPISIGYFQGGTV